MTNNLSPLHGYAMVLRIIFRRNRAGMCRKGNLSVKNIGISGVIDIVIPIAVIVGVVMLISRLSRRKK